MVLNLEYNYTLKILQILLLVKYFLKMFDFIIHPIYSVNNIICEGEAFEIQICRLKLGWIKYELMDTKALRCP